MVYPVHNKFVVRGSFGTTKEIWSNTLHFTSDVTAGPDEVPSGWDVAAVTAAVNAFYGSSRMTAMGKVTGWRGYQIGPDGRMTDGNIVVTDYGTPVAGAAAVKYPPQVALVISLHADTRGPGERGRIYFPAPNASLIQNTCLIESTDADQFLADFKTYVEALLDAMYSTDVAGEGLVNVSNSGVSGAIHEVTEYRVGLVLDTMRSRRNKLQEGYRVLAA